MDYRKIITIEPGKRGGKPCVRGLRITVYDVLSYLASGMSIDEVLDDFPALTRDDVREQVRFGAKLFAAFVGAGIVAGWVLYPLPF